MPEIKRMKIASSYEKDETEKVPTWSAPGSHAPVSFSDFWQSVLSFFSSFSCVTDQEPQKQASDIQFDESLAMLALSHGKVE